jgi:hypothetical protein
MRRKNVTKDLLMIIPRFELVSEGCQSVVGHSQELFVLNMSVKNMTIWRKVLWMPAHLFKKCLREFIRKNSELEDLLASLC